MSDSPRLSDRALKHLRRIVGRAGKVGDEAVYDLGKRLLALRDILTSPTVDSIQTLELTEEEQAAMDIICTKVRNGEGIPSARELSRSLTTSRHDPDSCCSLVFWTRVC